MIAKYYLLYAAAQALIIHMRVIAHGGRRGACGEQNIFLSFQSCVFAEGQRPEEEEEAVFVRLTGRKAQVWLHSASPL